MSSRWRWGYSGCRLQLWVRLRPSNARVLGNTKLRCCGSKARRFDDRILSMLQSLLPYVVSVLGFILLVMLLRVMRGRARSSKLKVASVLAMFAVACGVALYFLDRS